MSQLIKLDEQAMTKEFQKLSKAYDELLKHSKKDVGEILRSQARLFCIDMLHVTQPWGKGTKAKKMGEKAVKYDIQKVYLTEYDLYEVIKKHGEREAKWFYKLVKNGDVKEAIELAASLNINIKLNLFDGGKEHKKKRDRKGRVNRNHDSAFGMSHKVRDYTKEVQKRVGMAKAGWAHAAERLGTGRRIPAWIKKNKPQNLGTIKISSRGGIEQVLVINSVKYIGKLVDKYHMLKALNSRARAIQRLVKKVIEINANKALQDKIAANQTSLTPLLNNMTKGL